jgi:hypothetical protein
MIGDFRFKIRPGELQQYRIAELAIASGAGLEVVFQLFFLP